VTKLGNLDLLCAANIVRIANQYSREIEIYRIQGLLQRNVEIVEKDLTSEITEPEWQK
jgi:hypothetical protein